MNIQRFWSAVLAQRADEIREYFHPDAYVNWHCTGEHFTVSEFIRANCEYPGDWDGEIKRLVRVDDTIITVVKVYPKNRSASFHVSSFIRLKGDKIAAMDEYWADDGEAPDWRQDMKLGTPLKSAAQSGSTAIELRRELRGSILDLGSGGDGIIGQLYGGQVTAIDNRQEELDDAPDGFEKLRMDATEMTFPNGSFDNVTAFYTLMYMNTDEQQKALCEAARVLKPNGELHIWDCRIDSAYPRPFCVNVDITLPESRLRTTYGIVKTNPQNLTSILTMCETAGFEILSAETNGLHFTIKAGTHPNNP